MPGPGLARRGGRRILAASHANGSFQRTRIGTVVNSSEQVVPSSQDAGSNFYQAGFDASWELDVFGGVRRGIESADAGVQAAVEDRRIRW